MNKPVLLVLLLGSSCGQLRREQASDHIFVSGRIEGDEVDLAFRLPGRIAELRVREGDPVRAGEVIARLTGEQEAARLREAEARLRGARARLEQSRLQIATWQQRLETNRILQEQAETDAQPRVEQAESQLAAVKAELARVSAEAEQVRQDAKRYAELAEKGAIARQLAEQYASRVKSSEAATEAVKRQAAAAEAAVAVTRAALRNPRVRAAEAETTQRQIAEAQAAVHMAESDIAAAQAAVERARVDVGELELRAPFDGTVITRAAEPGRVIGAGQPVYTIVNLAGLYLRGFVPEGQIGLVKLNQAAQVILDSHPNQPLEAEVSRVDPQAMFTPENTYFKEDRVKQVVGVKLRLKANPGLAKPGMPADGRIKL
jgi:HlyD family secretion protein